MNVKEFDFGTTQEDHSANDHLEQKDFSAASNSVQKSSEEYFAFLSQMDRMDLTVLEAELNSGDFRLIYNSNPDYTVKMPEAAFEKFAQFFGNSQIHPDDQERYMEEIKFCHGPMFEQNLRRHSVFSRMFRPTIGEYQLHEFVTLRLETDTEDEKRKVLLLCQPIKTEQPVTGILSSGLLESKFLYNMLNKTLHCQYDDILTIVGGISSIQCLSGYTAKDIENTFNGCLMELICPEDRARVMHELDEHLAYSDTAEVEFRISAKDTHEIWVMACCHRVIGDTGESSLYCFLIESTQIREMFENELKRLRTRAQKNENIFRIVSDLSDRTLYEYDILTGVTRPWDNKNEQEDVLAHLYDSNYKSDKVEKTRGLYRTALTM